MTNYSKREKLLIETIYNYNRKNKTDYPVKPEYWKENGITKASDFINFVNNNHYSQDDLFENHPDYETHYREQMFYLFTSL